MFKVKTMVGKSEGKVAESAKAAADLSKGTHDGILCFGLLVVVNEIAMARLVERKSKDVGSSLA